MKKIGHIIYFEYKALLRNNILKLLVLTILGVSLYGIYFGQNEVSKQAARIQQVQAFERQQFDSLLHWVSLDTTIAENKDKFQRAVSPVGVGWDKHFTYYVKNDPPVLAGLCIGQRDLFPVYYGFNVTSLQKQIYISELANPMKLLTGNFDLAYVFVFLFPLLVIALFYNLYANEQEGGTLPLLRAQATSLSTVLFSKGLARFLFLIGVTGVVLLLGFVLQGISLTTHATQFGQWFWSITLYNFLWIVMVSLIVALKRGSTLSAMLGLSLWLFFVLITPAFINISLKAAEPLPMRAKVIHTMRTTNDHFWESPKSTVINAFNAKYPQYTVSDTTNFNQWYYASFVLLDEEAADMNGQFEAQVARRNKVLDRYLWLAPAALMHEYLSGVAKTDRESYLRFLEEVTAFHQRLKTIYYPKIYANEQFTVRDLEQLKVELEH